VGSSLHYVTVYEFSPFLMAGWPFLLFAFVLPIALWQMVGANKLFSHALSTTLGALVVLFVFGTIAVQSIMGHLETLGRVRSGQLIVLEGTVINVRCAGKGRQAFTVDFENFVPSAHGFQPGFVSGESFSNSVQNGMHVRIHYFDASWGTRIITKLENDSATGIAPPGVKFIGPCGGG
jgi:hypothetical protein